MLAACEVAIQVFDVTDPLKPRLAHKYVYDEGDYVTSEATENHKAFTYFDDRKLLAFPYVRQSSWGSRTNTGPSSTLEVFRVDAVSGIRKVGSVDHFYGGILANDVAQLETPVGSLKLAAPTMQDCGEACIRSAFGRAGCSAELRALAWARGHQYKSSSFLRSTREEREDPRKAERGQARPNVFFEAGIAFSQHQDRTVLVSFGSSERLLSDLRGVEPIEFRRDDHRTREKLVARLRAARVAVNEPAGWEHLQPGSFQAVLDSIARRKQTDSQSAATVVARGPS
jgi:hypothetical protein